MPVVPAFAPDRAIDPAAAEAFAAATPVRTAVASTNLGNGTISAGSVDATYAATPLASPVTITS